MVDSPPQILECVTVNLTLVYALLAHSSLQQKHFGSVLVRENTRDYRLLEITADYYRLLEITADYYRLLEITIDYCRLLQIVAKYTMYIWQLSIDITNTLIFCRWDCVALKDRCGIHARPP